jgi:cytochrome c peroxidase
MKQKLNKYLAIAFVSALLLQSCNKKNEELETTSDIELSKQLALASNGEGKSFYLMPESDNLAAIPQDPMNRLTKDKVELGKLLFHETGLGQFPVNISGKQTYSCASCHHAKAGFQACVPQGIGDGGSGFGIQGEARVIAKEYAPNQIDVQPIRTPSAMNMAYQTNVLWNGQFGAGQLNTGTQSKWTKGSPKEKNFKGFQGVETQALAGRDVHRLLLDRIFMSNVGAYKEMYIKAFNESSLNNATQLEDNGALAIAAYERTLLSNQAPFQLYLKGNKNALTENQKKGAVLFFGKGNCASCHNGPSLANMEFHAYGMNDLTNGNYGNNEVVGIKTSQPEHKGRGGFTGKAEDMYKFKVPQLYNLKDSPFYGHGASFRSVKEVIQYKNKGIAQNNLVPKSQLSPEFKPLNLSDEEINLLTDFIENGLRDPNLQRYVPTKLPSGLAFPNNDAKSRSDLGF